MDLKAFFKSKDNIQKTIILAIVFIWTFKFLTERNYTFWAGEAGIKTIPFLVASVLIDLW